MFTDEKQRAKVCQLLAGTTPMLFDWFTEDGPIPEVAGFLADLSKPPFSPGERIWFQVIMDLWNGEGGASFSDLFYRLDPDKQSALGSLMVAVSAAANGGTAKLPGDQAIQEWIDMMERQTPAAPWVSSAE